MQQHRVWHIRIDLTLAVPHLPRDMRKSNFIPCLYNNILNIAFNISVVEVHRIPWTSNETEAVWKHLGFYIKAGITPNQQQCQDCIAKASPVLNRRSWKDVKYKVRNTVVTISRKKFHWIYILAFSFGEISMLKYPF